MYKFILSKQSIIFWDEAAHNYDYSKDCNITEKIILKIIISSFNFYKIKSSVMFEYNYNNKNNLMYNSTLKLHNDNV